MIKQNLKILRRRGVTLVEILVVVGILMVIGGALATFQVDVFRQNNFIYHSLQGEQDARLVLKRLLAELRELAPSDTGAYAISLADKDKLTFYSDIDHDGLHERLRYFLSGLTLQRALLKPSGSPPDYVEANEQVSAVITNLTNPGSQVFSYYDSNYAGTSTSLTLPVNIPSVRLIKISLTIEPVTYESQVTPRSLKDNL